MSVLVCGLATIQTEPPLPPSPPLGPPRGTYFSRRKARHPLPPSPATTWMSTSSTNIGNWRAGDLWRRIHIRPTHKSPTRQFTNSPTQELLDWQDADDAARRAVILESHASGDLRENRIVFAEPGVAARTEAPAALPHDNGATGHEVAVVGFHAEALRVGIAPIPGTGLPFFVSHCLIPNPQPLAPNP